MVSPGRLALWFMQMTKCTFCFSQLHKLRCQLHINCTLKMTKQTQNAVEHILPKFHLLRPGLRSGLQPDFGRKKSLIFFAQNLVADHVAVTEFGHYTTARLSEFMAALQAARAIKLKKSELNWSDLFMYLFLLKSAHNKRTWMTLQNKLSSVASEKKQKKHDIKENHKDGANTIDSWHHIDRVTVTASYYWD